MELDKNWTVLVDGEKAEVTPFAGAFVGLYLEAGEHTLSFSYSPAGYAKGKWISLVSVLLFLCLAVAEKRGFRLFPEKDPMALTGAEEGIIDPAPTTEKVPAAETEKKETVQGEESDRTETDEHHP